MEVFAILSSCVALIAITLIFNLFVNLRNTDKAVQNEVKQSEIEKPKKNTDKTKAEPKKAEPKAKKIKIRPNDFKHQTLFTNLKVTVCDPCCIWLLEIKGEYSARKFLKP